MYVAVLALEVGPDELGNGRVGLLEAARIGHRHISQYERRARRVAAAGQTAAACPTASRRMANAGRYECHQCPHTDPQQRRAVASPTTDPTRCTPRATDPTRVVANHRARKGRHQRWACPGTSPRAAPLRRSGRPTPRPARDSARSGKRGSPPTPGVRLLGTVRVA